MSDIDKNGFPFGGYDGSKDIRIDPSEQSVTPQDVRIGDALRLRRRKILAVNAIID